MSVKLNITSPAELGAALREARRLRGLRLEDAAAGAGVGVRFLSVLDVVPGDVPNAVAGWPVAER